MQNAHRLGEDVAAHLAPTVTVPSVSAVLERAWAGSPDGEALCGRGGRFTYGELNRAVDSTAAARYKVPERVVSVDRLPRTAMGKKQRGEARSLYFPVTEHAVKE